MVDARRTSGLFISLQRNVRAQCASAYVNFRKIKHPGRLSIWLLGAGKSRELFHGLLPRLAPEASVCLIAPNIALARKYHEETKRKGLDYVCYLDEPGGKISARRVVVCVNSLPRVLPRFDMVVMDEVNFTLTNMASTVMKDKKQALRHTSRFYTIRNRGVWPSSRKAFILPMPGPLVGRGQPKATYSLVVDGIVDLVASGKTVMIPATSKTFVELLEVEFKARLPGKNLIAFHGAKREGADKRLLQHAISNPNDALIADCLAFTPTIGPGVSIEKKGSYDLVIGVAVNSDNHPDAQVLMQQIQRARDAGDIRIYYGEIQSRRKVAYPTTKEEVFQMLENSDLQLADLMQGVSVDHLDMLRAAPGERAIYDRSSATCNLYANNLLGRLQSRQYYIHLLTEDLRRQGVTVVNQLNVRTWGGDAEVELVAKEELVDETIEQWRERHLVSWEQFERIRGMMSSPSGGVSRQDVLRYEIFDAAVFCYGIQYEKVDPEFVAEFVQGKHAKDLMTKFKSYERFVTSTYASTIGTLSAAIEEGEQKRNIQEYLEVRDRSANGITYAWCVLAALVGIPAEKVENTVFGSYKIVDGRLGEEMLSAVFDMDDFNMSASLETLERLFKPRTSFAGKELTITRRRNVIKMVLEGGLGLTIRLAHFSNGCRRGFHRIVPIQKWRALDERYGGLKDKLVEKKSKPCLVEIDE
ncbi:hypothetical protein KFL_005960040 [Klebsormidium nitens]|uniref:Replication origin-binding protein domain-containing protein n=1 Tax=Klebsormidium nitens TaxID=105231 RepID=A0A1Y1IGR5_KLENI|nr:hypothetical protein KFL_005960040 [Klebsormidium nitens]|eukprot:GAQ90074.1 hypothetical protein KFL_005960040 [Klebsormidium nitens]